MERADVVVVGAGVAGLNAALTLARARRDVRVFEAGEDVGGRVRTDEVDGMLLDRGFQIVLPGYPHLRRVVDLSALDLRSFHRGIAVREGAHVRTLGDPRMGIGALGDLANTRVVSAADWVALAAMSARDLFSPGQTLKRAEERTSARELARRGLSERGVENVLRPFLSGVFLESELDTSSRFFHLVWRSFLRAAPALPARGMAAIPRQMAARLPSGALELNSEVSRIESGRVHVRGGNVVQARCVVVATDATCAGALLPELRVPTWNASTTYYFRSEVPPLRGPLLLLGGPGGPVVNSVVLNQVANTYAPPDRALIAASTLGTPNSPREHEKHVRTHLAELYGTETASWELVATYPVERALPRMTAPHPLRRSTRVDNGLYVCGDHRDTSSLQGALASGHRAARAVLQDLDSGR